jgi:hypothetical protein
MLVVVVLESDVVLAVAGTEVFLAPNHVEGELLNQPVQPVSVIAPLAIKIVERKADRTSHLEIQAPSKFVTGAC